MSCRTTSAGSAFTTYARLMGDPGQVHLSDVATLSLFHALRRTGAARVARGTLPPRTEADYQRFLLRQINRVVAAAAREEFTAAREASILARLRRAQTDPMPDQATIYALGHLVPEARTRASRLGLFVAQTAAVLGMTPDEVTNEFHAFENGIDRGRAAGNPESYTAENLELARVAGLGTEAGTVHAVAHFATRVARQNADQALNGVQRIVRTVYPAGPAPGSQILEAGFDPRNNRTEFVIRDAATGETTTHAYHGFTPNDRDLVDSGAAYHTWVSNLRGNPTYAYASQIEADLASAAPNCATCGQFANSRHSCPQLAEVRRMAPYVTSSRWSRQQATVTVPGVDGAPDTQVASTTELPAIREFRAAFAAGPVEVELNEYRSWYDNNHAYHYSRLVGRVTVYRDEAGATAFNSALLRCTCAAFLADQVCVHTRSAVAAMHLRLNPPARAASGPRTPEQRAAALVAAQAAVEAAAVTDWTRNEATLEEAAATWQTNTEVSYSADPAAFEREYNAAIEARAANNDQPVIPYMRENVLGGYAQRGSGQAFGMEIEYEFPATMDGGDRRRANSAIGQALFAAGLARVEHQEGYHAGKQYGFRDTQRTAAGTSTWSWENDGSVNGGELVSPGLYDEPETWDNLETAVRILTENGAIATTKAGAHVHVGTGMFNGDPKKYAELSRLMTQHEDVMHRLAADPVRGTIRGNSYSKPLNAVPAAGFQSIRDLKTYQRASGGRYVALNFDGVSMSNPATDHPEFRLFDSTLNAGAMQSQIKLSVAMVHAAARISDAAPTKRPKEALGAHVLRARARGRSRRPMTSGELIDDSATFRSLMDTLFTRSVDKVQMTTLFAQTKWAPGRRSR